MASAEFYELVERELVARKVPGLSISRTTWDEGGLLSAKREYLRLKRERYVFDICAAPFGVGYFFSYRFTELPIKINLVAILIVFFLGFSFLAYLFQYAVNSFGFLVGSLVVFAAAVFPLWLLRNSTDLGLADLDSKLLQTPVIGPLYERFLRKESYYREDTRLMYLSTVPAVVKKIVEEVTASNGVTQPHRTENKPKAPEMPELAVS